MDKAFEYRNLAAQLRRDAARTSLDRARQLKLAGAKRWDDLAAEVEMVVAPSVASETNCWFF